MESIDFSKDGFEKRIDRLISIYRTYVRTNKLLVVDLYVAHILTLIKYSLKFLKLLLEKPCRGNFIFSMWKGYLEKLIPENLRSFSRIMVLIIDRFIPVDKQMSSL